eukprot:IDg5171t1
MALSYVPGSGSYVGNQSLGKDPKTKSVGTNLSGPILSLRDFIEYCGASSSAMTGRSARMILYERRKSAW